jgi:hypothetical protein
MAGGWRLSCPSRSRLPTRPSRRTRRSNYARSRPKGKSAFNTAAGTRPAKCSAMQRSFPHGSTSKVCGPSPIRKWQATTRLGHFGFCAATRSRSRLSNLAPAAPQLTVSGRRSAALRSGRDFRKSQRTPPASAACPRATGALFRVLIASREKIPESHGEPPRAPG